MQNRRRFITTLVRGGMFTSIAALSGVLFQRWHASDGCRENFACGECSRADGCRLPEADHYRLEKAKRPQTNASHGRTR